jgi:outer membrane protein OmpA-like peptidoglycan-associated protein
MDLSQRRANSVMQYLTENGIPAERVTATGFGEANPIADNTSSDGRAQNRRVEFRLSDLAPAQQVLPPEPPIAPAPAPTP